MWTANGTKYNPSTRSTHTTAADHIYGVGRVAHNNVVYTAVLQASPNLLHYSTNAPTDPSQHANSLSLIFSVQAIDPARLRAGLYLQERYAILLAFLRIQEAGYSSIGTSTYKYTVNHHKSEESAREASSGYKSKLQLPDISSIDLVLHQDASSPVTAYCDA